MLLLGLLRWTARLVATAAAALFIAFLAGGNAPGLRELTDADLLRIGAVLFLTLATLIAWRWDLLGGALLLGGYALLAVLESGWPPLPLAPFGIAGAVLLVTGALRRILRRPRAESPPEATPAPQP